MYSNNGLQIICSLESDIDVLMYSNNGLQIICSLESDIDVLQQWFTNNM